MKVIHHPEEEILVETNHQVTEDLKPLEEEQLEDHLMEIPEVMDPPRRDPTRGGRPPGGGPPGPPGDP